MKLNPLARHKPTLSIARVFIDNDSEKEHMTSHHRRNDVRIDYIYQLEFLLASTAVHKWSLSVTLFPEQHHSSRSWSQGQTCDHVTCRCVPFASIVWFDVKHENDAGSEILKVEFNAEEIPLKTWTTKYHLKFQWVYQQTNRNSSYSGLHCI